MAGKTRKRIKYLPLNMRFNPGTEKFEPDLSLTSKKDKQKKMKISWFWIILLIILVLLFIMAMFYF